MTELIIAVLAFASGFGSRWYYHWRRYDRRRLLLYRAYLEQEKARIADDKELYRRAAEGVEATKRKLGLPIE